MKTKQYLKTLILLRIKWTGMLKIKQEDFIGAAPVMPCQNSLSIMSLMICVEGRTQITRSSPAAIGP